ncbi:FUSC family protein [Streptomyces cellulosae]
MLLPIAQTSVAATLAWLVATDVFGHRQAFFAPIAVVISIGVGLGRRLRRALELVVGVSVGIGVGDLLVSAIGTGPWQIALVVALAMTVAVYLSGGPLIALQAGSSAVLVATLLPPSGHGGVDRMLDAFIGGALGLAAVAFLPADPPAITRTHGRQILDELAAALSGAADAILYKDAARAEKALARARHTQQAVDDFLSAVATAREVMAFSPVRRHQRQGLERYSTAAIPVDHAMRNVRVLLRRTVAALRTGEPIPDSVVPTLRLLSQAAALLGAELATDQNPGTSQVRDALEHAAEILSRPDTSPSGYSSHVVMAQAGSITVDLLQALGTKHADALDTLPLTPPDDGEDD